MKIDHIPETNHAPVQPSESEMLTEFRAEQEKERWRSRHPVPSSVALLAGVLSGVIAGVGMALVLLWREGANGVEVWTPMQLMAATFYGAEALHGGAQVILVGEIVHAVIAIGYGLIFSFFVSRATPLGMAFLYGLVYSVLIWGVMTYMVLPLVDPVMQRAEALQPNWWFISHLVFGALLFLTPLLKNAFASTDFHR